MWILYCLLFLAGFVDSIAGGGGLISLSAYLAMGVPPHLALGTNKFSAFLGTGLSAAYFIRKGHVRWDAALYSFSGAVVGSVIGARLVLMVNERTLAWVLLAIIPVVAVFLILKRDLGAVERELGRGRYVGLAILCGLVIGLYDGFIGPGTGTFLIMAFTVVMGFGLLTACGNTKIVNFASNIAAVGAFMVAGSIDYGLGVPCAACSILGNMVGTRLAVRNGVAIIRPMMIVVIVLLLMKTGWDLVRV